MLLMVMVMKMVVVVDVDVDVVVVTVVVDVDVDADGDVDVVDNADVDGIAADESTGPWAIGVLDLGLMLTISSPQSPPKGPRKLQTTPQQTGVTSSHKHSRQHRDDRMS